MSVGIVVPCFNEASRWSPHYWAEVLQHSDQRYLFVDDGSTDGTRVLLERAVEGTSSGVLVLERNRGKAEAVRRGMIQLIDEYGLEGVGYLDADGAFGLGDIAGMTQQFRTKVIDGPFDAMWSSRVALSGRDIKRSGTRHYIGRAIATYISLGYGQIPYDTQSGYKLFAGSSQLRECMASPFRTRWLFELELLARWMRITGASMQVWEEPLQSWHDVPGSKIRGREVYRIVKELAVVKSEQRRR